ncbi:MAG: hypothetical protein L0G70_00915 [Rubrobacter sp.]|nr:hypothetical protein [Rubrobacter sp.]
MEFLTTGNVVVVILYLLPLAALVLIVRRVLKRSEEAAEAQALSREELERRYSEGRLSQEEYQTIRSEISSEENSRGLRREHDA